jgi:hypothetical protein
MMDVHLLSVGLLNEPACRKSSISHDLHQHLAIKTYLVEIP